MTAHGEVLIAAADLEPCRSLAGILSQWGLEPIYAATVGKAKTILTRESVSMVFCADRLADGSFRDVLSAAKLAKRKVCVVVISSTNDGDGYGDRYLEATRLGAFDVIPFPCRPRDVHRVVSRAIHDIGEKPHGPALTEAQEAKIFYDRWKACVFRFCSLFLGDKGLGSECAWEAFSGYWRERPVLQTGALPPGLMGFALAAVMRRSVPASSANRAGQGLREKVLSIPCDQRAVFILRCVLGMDFPSVSSATGLPVERVRALWLSSLFYLRAVLQRRFFDPEAAGEALRGHRESRPRGRAAMTRAYCAIT